MNIQEFLKIGGKITMHWERNVSYSKSVNQTDADNIKDLADINYGYGHDDQYMRANVYIPESVNYDLILPGRFAIYELEENDILRILDLLTPSKLDSLSQDKMYETNDADDLIDYVLN